MYSAYRCIAVQLAMHTNTAHRLGHIRHQVCVSDPSVGSVRFRGVLGALNPCTSLMHPAGPTNDQE